MDEQASSLNEKAGLGPPFFWITTRMIGENVLDQIARNVALGPNIGA